MADLDELALALPQATGGVDWGFNATDARIVVYAGGVPLHADGRLVGAVGASGGTAEEDEACITAAAQATGLDA